MKSIEVFTNDIEQKVKQRKKKRRIVRSTIALTCSFVFIFLIAFSNIISFGQIFESKAYQQYLTAYVSQDKQTRLRFLDGDFAALVVNEQVYTCQIEEKSKNRFALRGLEKEENVLEVTFSNNQANLTGSMGDISFNETLNAVENGAIEVGVWKMFGVEKEDGSISASENMWFLIDEEQSYVGEGYSAWECEFVSLGDIILQHTKDQVTGIGELSRIDVLPIETFGFPALKNTLYEYEGDSGFISYYKRVENIQELDFVAGTMETELITYKLSSYRIEEKELFNVEGVNWRLFPYASASLTQAKVKLRLTLRENGEIAFQSSENLSLGLKCGGKWYRLDNRILVVLDKEYPVFGLRAFVVYSPKGFTGAEFYKDAKAEIDVLDYYKVGYHTFQYYQLNANVAVYFGSEYTQDNIFPKLIYGKEYEFFSWKSEWHEKGDSFEKTYFDDLYATKLIFRESGDCEVYRNGEYQKTVGFTIYDYGDGSYEVRFKERIFVYIESANQYKYRIDRLNVGVGEIYSSGTTHMTENGVELIQKRRYGFMLK